MNILLLQGPSTPFFRWLAESLTAEGHRVKAVCFSGGDECFWRASPRPTLPFVRCPAEAEGLTEWYRQLFAREKPDAVLLFGDCRPIHRPAIALARELGLKLFVLEEGYLRPHWITLEAGGVNGYSAMPRTAEAFLQQPLEDAPEPVSLGSTLRQRVAFDILYHCANGLLSWRYPAYRSHRPYPIWQEYLHWLRRLGRMQWRKAAHREILTDYIERRSERFFLYPLQLDSDSQLRVHSHYASQEETIREIMASFTHAPADNSLLIKGHPLDNGMVDYQALVGRLAAEFGLEDRVHFVDGGHLPTLLRHCRGVVLINSTVGLSALQHHLPVYCLGRSIYHLPGLTHQGPLEGFWHEPQKPDSMLLNHFRGYLIRHTLVHGSFFRKVEGCFRTVRERIAA